MKDFFRWGGAIAFALLVLYLLMYGTGCESITEYNAVVTINTYTGVLSNSMRTVHKNYFTVEIPYQLGMMVDVYCSMPGQKLWREPDEWSIHEEGYVLIKEGTYSWNGYSYMVSIL